MNTRSFFKSLALLAAGAAVAPGIFVPKFEPVRWKVLTPQIHGCTFEQYLIDQTPIYDALILSEYYGKWEFVMDRTQFPVLELPQRTV